MRNLVLVSLVGGFAGLLGAVGGSWVTSNPGAQATSASKPQSAEDMSSIQQRLAALEQQLWTQQLSNQRMQEQQGQSPRPDTNPKAAPDFDPAQEQAQRAQEVAAQYELEQERQEALLAKHEFEPRDPRWSREQTNSLQKMFAATSHFASVDCKSSSCVARVKFDSRDQAVAYLHSSSLPHPQGCNGLVSVPPPENGGREYQLTVVYTPCNRPAS